MFGLRPRIRAGTRLRHPSAPAPAADKRLPDIPSLEGYTVQELRTAELEHLTKFDKLESEQITKLIQLVRKQDASG